MSNLRVRFAPSPTGALHIGGVRTALYNYLLARKEGGTFILRIEDTDQVRYVEGAEDYIKQSLEWSGIKPDEGPGIGGDYGPYRQSERKEIYQKHAKVLLEKGHLYYAFDTPEELTAKREAANQDGNRTFKYDALTRMEMRNSLTLTKEETVTLLASGTPHVLRLKVNPGEKITVNDIVRGEVVFSSDELDDKVMVKADGLPTYHLANIVDDHLMEISHVIRGEEWLPSTAHHIILYTCFEWEPPKFAHLPLILKPTGKGKLSKRDGAKLGIPVFPLAWKGATEEDSFDGFREYGFDPKAMVNFLAFLGWNPGTEQEIFSSEELVNSFSLEKIGKSGARFDYEKASWFNQQYIMKDEKLNLVAKAVLSNHGQTPDDEFINNFTELLKERVTTYPEFWTKGDYFFQDIKEFDAKTIRKKWKDENKVHFQNICNSLEGISEFNFTEVENSVKQYISDNELGFGAILPILRVAMTGNMKGPDLFKTMALLGKEKAIKRLHYLIENQEALKIQKT